MKHFFSLRMPKHYDKAIHICVLLLLIFGTIMVSSTIVGESTATNSFVISTMVKQFMFMIVSYLGMTYLARNFVRFLSREVRVKKDREANQKMKNRFRVLLRGVGFAIIVMMAATLLFAGSKGSKAWIFLGPISLQPSEFAKVYMIVLLGLVVNDYGNRRLKFFAFMKEPLVFYICIAFFLLLQPDSGTLMVFTAITCFCLLIPSNPCIKKLQKWIIWGIVAVVVLLLFLSTDFGISILNKMNLGYKFGRFTSAADPFSDTFNTGYNIVYSLYAIASGGLKGLGLGQSRQKMGFLPEAQTDFIFSVTIEELGIIGLSIIVVCYIVILYKLVYYAMKTKSEGYKIILIGTAVYLMIHFILNVGGVSALIPLTGVPLLFISSGGSSLLSIMALMGIAQSIISLTKSQMERLESKNKESLV